MVSTQVDIPQSHPGTELKAGLTFSLNIFFFYFFFFAFLLLFLFNAVVLRELPLADGGGGKK